jgi:hypothetical protein
VRSMAWGMIEVDDGDDVHDDEDHANNQDVAGAVASFGVAGAGGRRRRRFGSAPLLVSSPFSAHPRPFAHVTLHRSVCLALLTRPPKQLPDV